MTVQGAEDKKEQGWQEEEKKEGKKGGGESVWFTPSHRVNVIQ